jgi:hypothetical protein
MSSQTLRAGTRIELHGTPACGGFPGVKPEPATIARWSAVNGPIKNHVSPTNGGWHVVRFADGGKLCETRFRVVA